MAIWSTPRTWIEAQLVGAADMNQHVRDNLTSLYDAQHDVAARKTIVSPYTMVSAASGGEVFSDFTWTADGSSYVVEFFAGAVTAVTSAATIILTNGNGTILTVLGIVSAGATVPVFSKYYYTPAAGTATLNVVGVFGAGGGGTIQAGNGGATLTSYPPAYLRVTGVPI